MISPTKLHKISLFGNKTHKMTIQNGFWAKAKSRTKALNEPMPMTNMALRPRRSASWPKASWKAPATSEVEAVIHEISPCVMPRSRPMLAVTIMPTPVRNDVVAVATVAWKTKDTCFRFGLAPEYI